MEKDRLLAFSDGVIAVVITIMVLELKTPHGADFDALRDAVPVFFGYVLSFVYVAIYWNNHHHLFHLVKRVSGGVLWANLHLLFWISLIPFATGWLGENPGAPVPAALYGVSLLMTAIAWKILQTVLVRKQDSGGADLAHALGNDIKGKASPLLYLSGVALAFVDTRLSDAIYVLVALLWLIPDRRIERMIQRQ